MEVLVHAATARTPLYAAGLTVILTATLAACSSSSGGGSSAAAPATPLTVVRLAAKTSSGATSFTGTMSLQATAKTGGSSASTDLNASFAERLKPSLLAQVNVQSLRAGGEALPGGMTEILTPSKLYLKWSYLTNLLHSTGKSSVAPWFRSASGTAP
jgi:hypothetical protein